MAQLDYAQRLDALVKKANSMQGTSGQRALKKIIEDLEGDGPISELLHTLDPLLAQEVMGLLQEFFKTGSGMAFNTLHEEARERLL